MHRAESSSREVTNVREGEASAKGWISWTMQVSERSELSINKRMVFHNELSVYTVVFFLLMKIIKFIKEYKCTVGDFLTSV